MGNCDTHGYTATALSFTVVNLYIEFKWSLKDTVCVTGEVSLLGESLLIGWGTQVSAAVSGVSESLPVYYIFVGILWRLLGLGTYTYLPMAFMNAVYFLCWSQWRNILYTVRWSDDQYHDCSGNLWGSPGFNSNYNHVTRLSQGQFKSFKSELPLFCPYLFPQPRLPALSSAPALVFRLQITQSSAVGQWTGSLCNHTCANTGTKGGLDRAARNDGGSVVEAQI